MMLKKLMIIMTAVLMTIGWLPAAGLANEPVISLNVIPDQYRGRDVTVTGTTTLEELNMKVINSQGTIIYVNTFKPQSGGTYSHLFTLSSTEALGKATVVIGEGQVAATREFNIKASSSNGGGGGGGGTAPSNPSDSSDPSGSSDPSNPTDNSGVEVLVNGKAENAGAAATATVNNRTVTTITVDPQKLAERLAAEGQHAVITIPWNTPADGVIGQLNGQMVSSMERQQATIEIRTGSASYRLPAEQINIQAVSGQIGESIALEDITVQIEIANPTDATMKAAENAAASGGFDLVAPPLLFTVKAIHGDQIVEVARFNAYVERTMALPEGVDPGKVTTAVVIEPDGTVRHVPTQVVVADGKYYARINSLTNSAYSVIWNPVSFQDVERHWAKQAVNDMGSRLIINGVGNKQFHPDLDITRAEFAAIIVRGLGLSADSGSAAPFTDVKSSDWYNSVIGTAYAYNLINGYEDGTFRPTEKITREQAMVMMAKAMNISGLKAKLPNQDAKDRLGAYADASKVSAWAEAGIADCLQAGIVSGRSDSLLAPEAAVSRAEVAIMVQRLLQKSGLI